MLNLSTTTSVLQLVTGSAVSSIQVHTSFIDLADPGVALSPVTPGEQDTLITSAATTPIVDSPAASTDRNVKFISVQNTDPVNTCRVTIQHNDGTTVVNLFSIALQSGWTIQYNSDGNGFVVYDQDGNIQVASMVRGVQGVAAGTQTATTGTVLFSNSNGVSFGMSNNSVITASVNVSALDLAAIAAGTQTATSGTVSFANSNGVVFGMSGSSQITASYDFNVSAGTTSNNLSSIVFGNANNVSFGLAGNTVTASASVGSVQGSINLSAGTTSNYSSAFTFGNSNGISFGLNNGTITASGGVGTISAFSQDADFVTNFPIGQASLSLQKISIPMNLSATALALVANFSGYSNSTDAVTINHAVYALSAGTASLVSSASRVISWATGSQTDQSSVYGGASGTRYRTLGVSYAMTPGDYVFGWRLSTANGASVNIFGRNAMNIVGSFDGIETQTFLNGLSTSSVAAMPTSFAATDTGYVRTGFSALRQPGVILLGTN